MIPLFDPKKATTSSLLHKMDEIFAPGIPEQVFINLFMQCRVCSYTMTRRVFCYHACMGKEHKHITDTIIDLTMDDEDSESAIETEVDK